MSSWVVLGIMGFISFIIGLNLGMHGILDDRMLTNQARSSVLNNISTRQDSAPENSKSIPPIISNSQQIEATNVYQTPIDVIKVPEKVTEVLTPSQKLRLKIDEILKPIVEKAQQIVLENHSINVNRYKSTPIVLLTCNRPNLLRNTIKSLLQVRGVKKEMILIIQDGSLAENKVIADENGIRLLQNTQDIRLRGGAANDGAARIATHYKFALSKAFDTFEEANAIIIVEDDLLFSPDFYEYLTSTAPILDVDKSVFILSAWNDNGFKGKVQESTALRRTEYFPGLGWLLTRKLYKSELESKWPTSHWDHWLRAAETHQYREIVHPQVPRTYHNGIKGTFMDEGTHNRYFRDIDYNTNKDVIWNGSDNEHLVNFYLAEKILYEERIESMMKSCRHVEKVEDILTVKGEILCVWIDESPVPGGSRPPFFPASNFFGLWHEHPRGSRRGLHEFYFRDNYILLLNIYERHIFNERESRTYRKLKPSTARVIGIHSFDRSLLDKYH